MPTRRSPNKIAVVFGIELKAARKKAAITQQVLAELAEVDPVFVSLLENGHRQPSLSVIIRIEAALSLRSGTLVQRTARQLGLK